MIEGINVILRGNWWLLILLMVLAVGFSFFYYRYTTPPVSPGRRNVLRVLRGLAFLLAVWILFEPVVGWQIQRGEKPAVALLVDTSASMGLADRGVNRPQVVREFLQSQSLAALREKVTLKGFQFSDNLGELDLEKGGDVHFSRVGSDLKKALELAVREMAEDNFQGVILVSDGAHNLGEDPVQYSQMVAVPIFSLGVGDTALQKDVFLVKVETNEITYQGVTLWVDVTLTGVGYGGEKVTVSLSEGVKILESKWVTLPDDLLEKKVSLSFQPHEVGQMKYSVQVAPFKDELTDKNNRKEFIVTVLKSKKRVLLISGNPGQDFRFLKRALGRNKDVELRVALQDRQGRFHPPLSLTMEGDVPQYDCLILQNYPCSYSDRRVWRKLVQFLKKGKSPLLFLLGPQTDIKKLADLGAILPFQTLGRKGKELSVYVNLSPEDEASSIVMLMGKDGIERGKWADLPPIYSWPGSFEPREGSEVLAETVSKGGSIRKKNPVMVSSVTKGRKALAVLTYGLWRWDFFLWGVGKTNELYQNLWDGAIRWLVTEEKSGRLRVATSKSVYQSGENILFSAQVYTADYRPQDGAEVRISIPDSPELDLVGLGSGRYGGELRLLEKGDYTFLARALVGERVIEERTGKFSVEEYNIEFLNIRMEKGLLQRISENTGGKYYDLADVNQLVADLKLPSRILTQEKEIEIWNRWVLLAGFILLLSLEWFIRKRSGMM
ncbi:hypothetical protein ISS37_05905 [candidate division KSB1 bacterium]|nr:hypothetical protein [candidate division KSB1 bacterium]